MTRRIPAVLGIVIVIAAVHELSSLVPMLATMMRDGFELPALFFLLVGSAVAQLAAGVTIAIGWTHARFAVLTWTVLALSTFVFARDLLQLDGGTAVVFVELLAGPAIAWLVPLFVGDAAPQPKIPRAHVVSAGAHPGDGIPDRDLTSRRFDVGVVLFGLGITWIASTVLSRVLTFVMLAQSSSFGAGGVVGDLIYLAPAIAVGIFAFVAAHRFLDPSVEPQHARRALWLFVIVNIAGNVLRTAMMIGYLLVSDNFDHDITRMFVTQWLLGAALALVIPLFMWWYARPALASRANALPSPARLAAAPAWVMLWFAPFLVARLFVASLLDTGELPSTLLYGVAIACAIQGALYVVAAIATFIAQRETDAELASRSVRIARIAAIASMVNAIGMIACWVFVKFGLDAVPGFRQQVPIGPLVHLVAAGAAMWWALRRRR